MRKLKSCGVLLFRREPSLSFLLMRHESRWDLPKGHVDDGETDLECALREMEEETGVAAEHVSIDREFAYSEVYYPTYKRYPNERIEKTLRIYLGWLTRKSKIRVTEHIDYEWFDWQPPHAIQEMAIDPLLAAVAEYLDADGERR